jgi:hypothetical protein
MKGITFVYIERYMNLSIEINHAILHCLPVLMEECDVIQKFKEINSLNNFGFEDIEQVKRKYQGRERETPYYIILQINNKRYMKHVDKKDRKFDLGRQIIC